MKLHDCIRVSTIRQYESLLITCQIEFEILKFSRLHYSRIGTFTIQTVFSHIYESFIYRVGVSLIVVSFQFRSLNCRSFEVIIAILGLALNSVLQHHANKQSKCAIRITATELKIVPLTILRR